MMKDDLDDQPEETMEAGVMDKLLCRSRGTMTGQGDDVRAGG